MSCSDHSLGKEPDDDKRDCQATDLSLVHAEAVGNDRSNTTVAMSSWVPTWSCVRMAGGRPAPRAAGISVNSLACMRDRPDQSRRRVALRRGAGWVVGLLMLVQ